MRQAKVNWLLENENYYFDDGQATLIGDGIGEMIKRENEKMIEGENEKMLFFSINI